MIRLTPFAAAVLALSAPIARSQTLHAAAVVVPAASPAAYSPLSSARPAAAPVRVAQADLPQVAVQGDADRAGRVSLTKLPANVRDVPQSITVVDKTMMQSQGATSLADALRNVPGITLGGAEGGQIGNNINLNGFSARTDVYLDGFRDRGQYYRDVFALDAVEVLMGPSSMLFGRGSTGGVINQVTKKARLRPLTEASASVTTNGLVRSTVDVDRPIDATSAWRFAAMAQDGAPTTRRKMTVSDYGIAPSYRAGIGTPTEITLSALLQHNHDLPDYGVAPLNGHPVQTGRDTVYGSSDDRTNQDVAALNASINHKFTPTTSLRSQFAYFHVKTDAQETAPQTLGTVSGAGFTAFTPAATSALPLDRIAVRLQSHDRVIRDSSISNQTELSTRFDTGSVKHALIVGGEYGHDEYHNQNYFRNGSCNGVPLNAVGATTGYVACEAVLSPPFVDSPANAPKAPGNLATATANGLAGYVNDTVELTPQWKLVAGWRHDRYAATIGNSINSANTRGNTTLGNTSQTVSYNSVRAGGIWQPNDTQSYYVSYSTSFNPSLEQLVSTTGISQPLPPQTNKAYEAGAKLDTADGNLSVTGAVFQITQDNARSQNADSTYTATGTIRVNGARAGVTGKITPQWTVFSGATYLDAKITHGIAVGTQGMVPGNTAKGSATLWTTYLITPEWEVGGGGLYLSQRFANNTDTVEVGGYVRLDATAAWHQPKYDLRLNVFNLGNKHYYDALIQSDGGRSVPGTGITGMLTFTYHL